jgi:hypothetical protein
MNYLEGEDDTYEDEPIVREKRTVEEMLYDELILWETYSGFLEGRVS